MKRLVFLVALGSACSFSGPPAAEFEPTLDAAAPDGDVTACQAGALECTGDDTLGVCRADGSGFDEQACSAGCSSSPEPHCATFTPSNGVDAGDATGVLDTAGRAAWVLNTDTGAIVDGNTGEVLRAAGTGIDAPTEIGFEIIDQSDGPSIGVFQLAELRVAELTAVRGTGVNALAIAARGEIAIAGVIDVRGGRRACFGDARGLSCAGPGAFAGGGSDTAGDGPAQSGGGAGANTVGESGGGGGGHGLRGGAGGAADSSDPGPGGAVFGADELTPLIGGAGGGGGGSELQDNCLGTPPFPGGVGGGGGGAVQLVADRIVFVAGSPCGVTAGGGGGSGGECNAAGGGGGAGGAILIEAGTVELATGCTLAANGGGGGSASSLGVLGAGQDGRLSTAPASGGDTLDGTAGGAGGTGAPAQSADSDSDEAGGGGGGAGRIRVNSSAGRRVLDGDISPIGSAGDLPLQ